MRYFYDPPDSYDCKYGELYSCDHPIYNYCTLYRRGPLGLAVVQQRFNTNLKVSWWGPIDRCLVDDIFTNPLFDSYFRKKAGIADNGIFPTVRIRQIMWALKMKPLKKEEWEQKLHHI